MKCNKCQGEFMPPAGVVVTNCLFCQAPMESEKMTCGSCQGEWKPPVGVAMPNCPFCQASLSGGNTAPVAPAPPTKTLPSSVIRIEAQSCPNLVSLKVRSSDIDMYAFRNCPKLTYFELSIECKGQHDHKYGLDCQNPRAEIVYM